MTIIKSFINNKGGVNNLLSVKIINGYCVVKCFTGKTAETRANLFIKKTRNIKQ